MQSPQVLVGTFDQMVEELQRRREPCGFSYVAFALDAYLSMGPVVESLSGSIGNVSMPVYTDVVFCTAARSRAEFSGTNQSTSAMPT